MKVIMTVGVPGSGKTTWAEKEAKEKGYLLHSLDRVRQSVWGSKNAFWDSWRLDPNINGLLVDIFYEGLDAILFWRDALPGLIIDNTHLTKYEETIQMCLYKDIVPEIVVFHTPLTVLLERNDKRTDDDRVPPDAVRDYYSSFQQQDAWWRTYEPKRQVGHILVKEVAYG